MVIIVVGLLLSASQADEKKSVVSPIFRENAAVSPAVQERPTVPVDPKLPEEILEQPIPLGQKKVVEETVEQQNLTPMKSPPRVDLNLSDGFLKKLDSDQNLASDPPKKIAKETVQQRKIKVSGGGLFDPENENLLEKVDGGEVKISIPLK